MPLPTVIADLKTTASLNYPAGTDSPAVLDDVQRAHASFIAQLRDANTGTNTGDNATNTQYSGLAASKAAAGANTDITSLGGLTTPLSIAQGGTGGATAAAARTALGVTPVGLGNRIINGNFGINQRVYVSGAAVGAGLYGHDRWKMAASADTYTFSTTANVTTITIPAGKVLQQVIEGLNLETGTYTLSWTGTAQGKIGAGAYGASGVTGAITGGTNTTIEFGPGTVSKVQLEFGSTASLFEQRPYGLELALCQRYLPAFNAVGSASICMISAITSTDGRALFPFSVVPRVPPTGIKITAAGDFYALNTAASMVALTALTFSDASHVTANLSITVGAASFTAGGASFLFSQTSGPQILFTGCEL